MKQAKRILSVILALVMVVSVFVPMGHAYKADMNDYNLYRTNPFAQSNINGVDRLELSINQGAGWLCDLLDDLLKEQNIYIHDWEVPDVPVVTVTIENVDLRNVDSTFWTLYNLFTGLQGNKNNLMNVLTVNGLNWLVSQLGGTIVGDLASINVTALGDQNSPGRVARNIPNKPNVLASNDYEVLTTLLRFLGDNAAILSKIGDASLNSGLLGGNLSGEIGLILNNFPQFLRNTLYGLLADKTASEAPSGWTYDAGIQNLINWALVTGTGDTPASGANSLLGPLHEPILPEIANYPGAAYIDDRQIQADRNGDGVAETVNMNFYQIVNNAINALLSGLVSDLLLDLLVDALKIDTSEDPRGNPEVLQDTMYNLIVGAVKTLFENNGAPTLLFNEEQSTYPIPQLQKLLDWLFVDGALETFISIEYAGISLTDNFVSLFNDLVRLLPSLMPVFGVQFPEGLVHSAAEMTAPVIDNEGRYVYLTFQGEEIRPTNPPMSDDNEELPISPENASNPQYNWIYCSNSASVNTDNVGGANYRNPRFFRTKKVMSNQNIYADLLKLVFNMVVPGAYYPEWADTVSEVGAYGLAGIAAQYLPENNYYDRLDKYHFVTELGQTYTPRVDAAAHQSAIPYTEDIQFGDTTVTVPRAVMDIGASLAAYFLNGWQTFREVLGYTPKTDTNFETYLCEFLCWAASEFAPVFVGRFDSGTSQFVSVNGIAGTFQNVLSPLVNQFINLQYPGGVGPVVPSSAAVRPIAYAIIDQTLLQLIPASWMPAWISSQSSPSSALFNWWLFNSVAELDLQQLFRIFEMNVTPGADLTHSVTKVLVDLVDRIFGTIFGGEPILPPLTRTTVFGNPTSLTTFEGLLGGGSTLKGLINGFLSKLDKYRVHLLNTILPIAAGINGCMVKSHSYYVDAQATAPVNYVGTPDITFDQLRSYADTFVTDLNAVRYTGTINFFNEQDAINCSTDINVDYTEVIDGGVTKYAVTFPLSYETLRQASSAVEWLDAQRPEYEHYTKTERKNGQVNYYAFEKESYLDATATVAATPQPDGSFNYAFTNFNRALPQEFVLGGDTSFRDHNNKGVITYGDGYRISGRENYATGNVMYNNRLDNAVEDAEEFMGEYETYYKSTLPGAYGEWMMFFVKAQLDKLNLYDSNHDGVVDHNDSPPGVPKKTDFPFGVSNATTLSSVNWRIPKTYYFNAPLSSPVVAAALAYADEIDPETGENHDVVLSDVDAEAVVRLALGSLSFDITNDDPDRNDWETLDATQLAAISAKCTELGFTFDQENFEITRKSFQLIGATIAGQSNFGQLVHRNSNPTQTVRYTLGITPVAFNYIEMMSEEDNKLKEYQNEQFKAYVKFQKNLEKFNAAAVTDYYDNISWRAERAIEMERDTLICDTLDWVLSYTQSCYYPHNVSAGKNRHYVGSNLVPKYTKVTFDRFQKAYDYALQLRTYLTENSYNNNVVQLSQSIISEAYQGVLKAFYGLKLWSGAADWAQFLSYYAQGAAILVGPLGLAAAQDPDLQATAYTLATLQNLQTALYGDDGVENGVGGADEFYQSGSAYTGDEQSLVDERAFMIRTAIDALRFMDGVIPSIIPNGNIDFNLDVDTTYYRPGDSRLHGIITNLTEYVRFIDGWAASSSYSGAYDPSGTFTGTGFTVDGNTNNLLAYESPYGGGTGSYIEGTIANASRFVYYAVLFGDLNGDTRIDGVDNAIIKMHMAADSINTGMALYQKVAADVNFDGDVDSSDVEIINNKYKYHTATIDQSTSPSTAWFPTNP